MQSDRQRALRSLPVPSPYLARLQLLDLSGNRLNAVFASLANLRLDVSRNEIPLRVSPRGDQSSGKVRKGPLDDGHGTGEQRASPSCKWKRCGPQERPVDTRATTWRDATCKSQQSGSCRMSCAPVAQATLVREPTARGVCKTLSTTRWIKASVKPALRAARLQLDLRPFRPASAPMAYLEMSRTRRYAVATPGEALSSDHECLSCGKLHLVCNAPGSLVATAPLEPGCIRLKEPSEEIFECLDRQHCRNSSCTPGLGRGWTERVSRLKGPKPGCPNCVRVVVRFFVAFVC